MSRPIDSMIDTAFGSDVLPDLAERAILRHGAEVLSKLKTWACSLNLAPLLHWRSKL